MENPPELVALLTEIRDLLREQGAQQQELATRAVAQQEQGIAIARRAQKVLAPLLAVVFLILLGVVAWAWWMLRG